MAWRYAILITHEIIETAVSYFATEDLDRFKRSFNSIIADDYATVPHLSIERLIALRKANKLNIVRLGDQSLILTDNVERGATVTFEDGTLQFDTFIDATGQKTLSADDLPFPSLHDAGLISQARTFTPHGNLRRTGGIDIDKQCRPLIAGISRFGACTSQRFAIFSTSGPLSKALPVAPSSDRLSLDLLSPT